MSSIIIDYLRTEFDNEPGVGIAYIFCNYHSQHQEKPENLLSSLLKQLAHRQPTIPPDIVSLHKRHVTNGTIPTVDDIARILLSTINLYSRVFVVIDALDEYYTVDIEGQNKFLSELFSIQGQVRLNFFATSRFVSEIILRFDGYIWKEIRAQDNDVLRYIDGRIPQLLRSQMSKHPELRETIRRDVITAVDGMYVHYSISTPLT